MKKKRGSTGNKHRPEADARVLGQILAAQNIEFVLPNTTHIAEFFAETLMTIPGVLSCRVCLEDMSIQRGEMGSGICEECVSSRRKSAEQKELPLFSSDFKCRLDNQLGVQFNAISSLHHHFGFFVFQIDDLEVFNVYKPFIVNLANYVAISLENRLQRNLLEKARDGLEHKVEERTQELTVANVHLQEEIENRRQIEEALRESERQIKQLIDSSPVAMVVSSGIKEHVEWVNDKFIELFGYTSEDMPSAEHWWPLAYPDVAYREAIKAQWQTRVEQAIRTKGQIQPMEATVRCKDGSYRYVEFRLSSIGSKHLITFVDLTERKRVEDALAAREMEMRNLADSSPGLMGMFHLRPDGTICMPYTSPQIQNLFDLRSEDLVDDAAPLLARTHPDDIQWVNESIAESARTMTPWHIEYRILHPTRGELWLEGSTNPKPHPDGGIIWYGFVHDITKRKQAEEALLEREKHSQSLLRLSRNLERSQTYNEVLNAARDEVKAVIGYQNLWAYLLTDDKKHFKALIAGGLVGDILMTDENVAMLTITGDRMLEEIAEAREIVMVEDAQTDERTDKEIVTRLGNRTIVNIPIILFDKHLGTVGTGTFGDEGVRVPTKTEQEYLMALASHMAVSLDRIHLFNKRGQAEQSLRESEERFRSFVEKANDIVYTISPDEVFTYVSPNWKEILGHEISEVEGKSFEIFVHPDDLATCREVLSRTIKSGEKQSGFEYRVKHKNGSWQWHTSNASVIRDRDDRVISFLGIARNITERKQAEAMLRKREQEFRTLAENSPDVIVRYDTEGRRIYVNPEFERVNHLSAQEVQGKTPVELSTELAPKAEVFTEKLMAVIASGTVDKIDLSWTKDEKPICWFVRLVPEFDADGKVASALTIWSDISERKRAEEALRESEEKYRLLHENAGVGIGYYKPNGEVISYNYLAASHMQGKPEDFKGKSIYEIFPKQEADFYMDRIKRSLLAESMTEYEDHLDLPSGDKWFLSIYGRICDSQKNVIGVQIISQDITERKRNERELITLNRAINQSTDAVFLINEQLVFAYVNDAACRSLGYTREELLTMGPSDIDATITYDAAKGIMSKQFRNGSFPRFETQHKTRDGRVFPVEISSSVVDYDGAKFSLTTVHDITERKQAEEKLRESEERYRAISNLTSDYAYSFRLEADGTYTREWTTETFFKITGYLPTDPQFMSGMMSIVHPDDRHILEERNRRSEAREEVSAVAYRIIRKDGEIRWLNNFGGSTHDEATGKAIRFYGAVSDITERKRAEEDLRASEEKYRALAENIPNVVFQCKNDLRYTFIYLNNAIEELTGYSKDDFLEKGLSFLDLYHPDDLETMPTPRENNIAKINQNPFHVTYRIRHKSGEWRWVDEWGTGILGTDGRVEYLEGVMMDVTERKLAEQTLLESEERYRLLVSLSPDAIGIHKQGIIAYANPAMLHIAGSKNAEDLIGKPVLDFIHLDFHEIIQKRINGELGDNIDTFVEEKFIKLDGSQVDVEVAAVPYEYQGQRYTQVIARDITQRKQHEREREAIISVSAVLRQAGTKTGILNIILDQLVSLFEVDGAMLVMPNAQTGGFVNEMGRGIVGERMTGLVIPAGRGVCSWVTANKTAYLNNHADQDPLFYRPELLGNSHCVACAPLLAQEQVIGSLWLARQMDFVEQDLHLLTAIADIAANAIHRVMLHEQTELQLHHLIALHQIDIAISSNFDSDLTLNVILGNVKNELEMDAVDILLISPVTHTLDFVAGLGFRTHGIEQSHVKLADGFAGTAAQEYRTVSCPDLKLARGTFSRSSLLADEEFVAHFATPLVVKGQVKGVLELFHRKAFEPESDWIDYFETLATQAAIAIESASLVENLQRSNTELILAYDATIEGWSRALDLRDKETEGHTQRVTDMALELADKMGISEAEKQHLWRGSLLHDIGKMGVPDSILLKPGPLSEAEEQIMRQHPMYAYQMLSPIAYLKPALEISYCHHEKWDGSGYPRGLKGEEIPLSARLFAVVDVFDALTSDRPYRRAWPREDAYSFIQEQSGKHFDPQIVKIVLENKMW